MNRRGFVKALAALPAAVGGLIAVPKLASPDEVEVAAVVGSADPLKVALRPDTMLGPFDSIDPETFDRFLRETTHLRVLDGVDPDPFDLWLSLLGEDRYRSTPVGGLHVLEGGGLDFPVGCSVTVDGKEIVGKVESFELEMSRDFKVGEIGEPHFEPWASEMTIELKIEDRMSERLQEIAEEFKRAAEEATISFREMEARLLEGSILPEIDADPMTVIRTSKPAKLAGPWSLADDEDYLT